MQALNSRQAKPLYKIVADAILGQIEAGVYQEGERLPSESELQKMYNVGRNTIRHALSELNELSAVTTVQGVGTFVDGARFSKTANFLMGFSQEMQIHGRVATNKVLTAKLIKADVFLSRRLQMQLGAEVVFIHRLRYLDGEPVANERAYLPHHLCPGILKHDFSDLSLYKVLAEEFNMKPDHAEQEILADLATEEVAKLLGLSQPAVVLIFHRETFTQDNLVIEYVDSEFRGDRFQFFTQLQADARNQHLVLEHSPVGAPPQEG
jgi:GntR family transcriptional regulator